jgi:hypothetical protein
MLKSSHRFSIALHGDEGRVIHSEEARTLGPLYEDLLFTAVRAGVVPNDGSSPPATVVPVWREGKLSGLEGALGSLTKHYALAVFRDQVLEILVKQGLLKKEGEDSTSLRWEVNAVETEVEPGRPRFRVSTSRLPFPLAREPLDALGIDDGTEPSEPFALYISSGLLAELKEATGNSLDVERADALTGRLVQEAEGRLALVLLGRIAVEKDTEASAKHFSFWPTTFDAIRRESERRGDGLILCGWHHNHPPPCGRSCLMLVPACSTRTVFLSIDDRAVFRASFGAPYMVGLVSGKGEGRRADDPHLRAYGWKDGVLCEREFKVF